LILRRSRAASDPIVDVTKNTELRPAQHRVENKEVPSDVDKADMQTMGNATTDHLILPEEIKTDSKGASNDTNAPKDDDEGARIVSGYRVDDVEQG
jgi:hypothetical protein